MEQLVGSFQRDVLSYSPAKIVPAIVGILNVIILTHLFSPEEYGHYALALAAAYLAIVIFSGWLQQSTLRLYPEAKKSGNEKALFSSLLVIVILTCGLFVIVFVPWYLLLGSHWFAHWGLGLFYLWSGAWVVIMIVYNTFLALYQAQLQARRFAIYESLRTILGLLLTLGYIWGIEYNIFAGFVGLTLASLIVSFWMAKGLTHVLNYKLSALRSSLKYDPMLTKQLVGYGLPLVGWLLGMQILNISDRFIIEYFWGSTAVGIYSSNYYLADGGGSLLFLPLVTAAQPLIMHAWAEHHPKRVQALITAISRYCLILFFPFLAITAVLSQEIVGLFLSPAYREGHVILGLVLAGGAAWSLGLLAHKGLELSRKTWVMLGGVSLCAAVNLVLNFIFVPLFGYLSAAITTLISYLLYPLFAYQVTKRYLIWHFPWRSLWNTTVAAIAMGIFLHLSWHLLQWSIWLKGVSLLLSLFLYGGTLYLIREIDRQELRALWGLFRRSSESNHPLPRQPMT